MKLCLADAIHSFKWMKMISIGPNGGQSFSIPADWRLVSPLKCTFLSANSKYYKSDILLGKETTLAWELPSYLQWNIRSIEVVDRCSVSQLQVDKITYEEA